MKNAMAELESFEGWDVASILLLMSSLGLMLTSIFLGR